MLFLPRIQVELPLHLNVRRPHDLRPFGEFRSTETEMGGAGSHEANRLGFDMLKSRERAQGELGFAAIVAPGRRHPTAIGERRIGRSKVNGRLRNFSFAQALMSLARRLPMARDVRHERQT